MYAKLICEKIGVRIAALPAVCKCGPEPAAGAALAGSCDGGLMPI